MKINGKDMSFPEGTTVFELLQSLNVDSTKVAVEVDLNIVEGNAFKACRLKKNSSVEIIRFVGGGC